MGSGFDDCIYWHFCDNYNQLWQLTNNDFLWLAPFLAGLRVSSLPLWRTANEQFLPTELNDDDSPGNEFWASSRVVPFITWGEPNRGHHLEHLVIILPLSRQCVFCKYSLPQKRVSIRGNALTFTRVSVADGICVYRTVAQHWTSVLAPHSGFRAVLTEPLPSAGHIRQNIIILL
jgi:hypothetical protein